MSAIDNTHRPEQTTPILPWSHWSTSERLSDFESEYTKNKKFWPNLILRLREDKITAYEIRSTFMSDMIFGCKLYGSLESTQCSQFTDISVTTDDSHQCYTLFADTSNGKTKMRPLSRLKKSFKKTEPFVGSTYHSITRLGWWCRFGQTLYYTTHGSGPWSSFITELS